MKSSRFWVATILRLAIVIGLVAATFGSDDGSTRRKTRGGRWTATDLQLFNPNFRDSKASVEWITDAGLLQATLPVSVPLRSTRYYTIEESGIVSPSFVGAVEVVSATQELYGVVTHFDKGGDAPSFERGNEHYEVRDLSQGGTALNVPLIIQNGVYSTNISILNPADNGATTVAIELYDASGAITLYNTTITGNALIEISPTIVTTAPFVGSARILSNKPIAAYISIYDGETQGGYSASVDASSTTSITNRSASSQRNQLNQPSQVNADQPQGVFPNLQPTDDISATRNVFIVNVSTQPATVTINSKTSVLNTLTVPPRGQISAAVPFSKAVTAIFVAANQPIESAMTVRDNTINPVTFNLVTGFVVYPMLKLRDQSQVLSLQAMHALYAHRPDVVDEADVVGPPGVATYCAVAPTVYGGYRGWETTLKLLNPLSVTGSVTVTFFPSLSASDAVSTVVVTRALPPNVSVVPNYVGIVGSNSPWSAYLESTVPFYGDATSIKPNEADGLMSYRIEPITCVKQRSEYLYLPLLVR